MKMLQVLSFLAISGFMNLAQAASVKMQVPALQGIVQSSDLRIITLEPYIGCSLHDGAELINGDNQEALNTQLNWQSPTSVQFQTAPGQVKLTKWFTSHGACYAGVHVIAIDAQNQTYQRSLHVIATARMNEEELQNHVDSQEWSQEVQAAFQNLKLVLLFGDVSIEK